MTYYNNIPKPTDTLQNSQPQLLANFGAIQTLIDVNHVDFASTDQGKHKWVTYPQQGAQPAPPFLATEISTYNQQSTLTGSNELFVQKGPGGAQIPMTASSQFANGWSYLPSGILMKWGAITGTFPPGAWYQFLYPTGADIPVFNAVFIVNLQSVSIDIPPGSTNYIYNFLTVANNYNATGFWWAPYTSAVFGNVDQRYVFYFAIGY